MESSEGGVGGREVWTRAVEGGEVIVKPPAWEMEGMWTSSH